MLERILNKLGVETAEELIESENRKVEKYRGMEVDIPNPFLALTFDEMDFLTDYLSKKSLI